MLIDGIVKNRGAISKPWNEYKRGRQQSLLVQLWRHATLHYCVCRTWCNFFCHRYSGCSKSRIHRFWNCGHSSRQYFSSLYILASVFVAFFIKTFVIPCHVYKKSFSSGGVENSMGRIASTKPLEFCVAFTYDAFALGRCWIHCNIRNLRNLLYRRAAICKFCVATANRSILYMLFALLHSAIWGRMDVF